MSNYAVIFDKNNITFRLPVNPEAIEVSSAQSIETYEILKLGKIALPSYMELKEYSFEAELPHEALHYVETPNKSENNSIFKNAEFYLKTLEAWRKECTPIRFMAGMTTGEYTVEEEAINTLVLIEGLTITEKAGEEKDKYVTFKLLEYRSHSMQEGYLEVDETTGKTKAVKKNKNNPKAKGYYVVKSGDSLWAIAKKSYGDGSQYTKILNANKDKISNPSLIYPGQKLVIPL